MEPTDADFDDMHHALGRPKRATSETYRNYYCTPAGGETAQRFEALGWWDFCHTINGGCDAIYVVNGAGGQALDAWLTAKQGHTTGHSGDGSPAGDKPGA